VALGVRSRRLAARRLLRVGRQLADGGGAS
jgi:hypothetical protein